MRNGPGGAWTSAQRFDHEVTTTGSYYMMANPTIYATRVREIERVSQTVLDGPAYRVSQVKTDYEVTYGLPVKVTDSGDTAASGDDRCVLTSYAAANTGKWLIGLPSEVTTTNCGTPISGVIAESQMFYDGSTTLNAVPQRGLATLGKANAGGGTWIQTGSSSHDVYGRIVDSFDALNRQTSTVYTPATGGPVTGVAVTGPMGSGWTVTTTLDPRFGVPVKVVDVNGKTIEATYDAAGRLLKVWKHNRLTTDIPDVEYVYTLGSPSSVTTKTLGPDGQQIVSYAMFDGQLRPRQTQTPAASGSGRTIVDTVYNGLGSVAKQSTFYNSAAPSSTIVAAADDDIKVQQRYTYDNLGRQTAAQQWTGDGTTSSMLWQASTAYDGDKYVRTTPPAGGTATTTVNDARGKTVELREHVGGTPSGAVDTTTTYGYDRLGQLTQVTDTAGNQWTYDYDWLGRKTSTVDPDAGTSTTTYDNAGQVVSTTDARGQALFYEYDLLGRKTKQRDGTAAGPVMAQWVYDTYDKGQLASSIRHAGTDQYVTRVTSRDDAYRPLHTEVVVPNATVNGALAGTYSWDHTYKANGAPATTELPAAGGIPAETLTHTYDTNGLPDTITGAFTNSSHTYLADTGYTYDGLVSAQYLGEPGKQVKLTNSYDDATRRIERAYVYTENQTTPGTFDQRYRTEYQYDDAGNITLIGGMTDGARDQVECFRYDHLRRLTEAWSQATVGETCNTPKRAGADPYWRQWTFDDLGNRTMQVDKDPTGGDTTWTYHVGTTNGVKPHQLKQVNATGPKAGTPTRTYGYDLAGNTTSATTATGGAQALTWDKEGHLASVTEGSNVTSYVYDADGNRLIARDQDKTTLHLPDGTEIELSAAGGPLLGTRYYGATAVRDANGLKWICSNHQGSNIVQIDAITLDTDRRRMMPYGEDRGTQPTDWMGTKGYVGGTKDNTAYTHLGAREYDPTLGRFISVDPIMDLTDPQQWHGYAYSHNSPITFSDPTGLKETCDSDGNYVCAPTTPEPPTPPPPPPGCYGGNRSASCQGEPPSDNEILNSGTVLGGELVIADSPEALDAAMGDLRARFCDTYSGAQGKIGCSADSWMWQSIFEEWALIQICTLSPSWCYLSQANLSQRAMDLSVQENGLGRLLGKLLGLGRAGKAFTPSLRELGAAADATIPVGVSRAAWGAQVWGTGPNAAAAARGLIGRTPEALAKISNLTVDTARAWRDLYQAAAGASRGGGTSGTAQARVDLMNDIIRTLGGTP